ncbi:MAG: hypothetical protein ABIG68_06470 [Acidobacteriota bacterium]
MLAFSLRFIRLVPAFLTVGLGAAIAATPQMVLDYQYRYNCQSGEPDHLLDAVALDGGRALVAGNRGIAMVDLSLLTREGSRGYIHRLTGLNARNLYVRGHYVYVNLNRGETQGSPGFAVVRIDPDRLVHLRTIDEAGVLYEKMCIDGDSLFVAAHNKGIRVFSLADPESPALIGRLDSGFDDAWAVAVRGSLAYVADGGGGLKIVDVTDRTRPVLTGGEDTRTALGSAQDVVAGASDVYVGAGGAGLLTYREGSLARRYPTRTGGAAKHLRWLGDYLVVATMGGLVVLEPGPDGRARTVASEIMARRGRAGSANATLRICSAAGVGPDNLVLSADWNYMDVYKLVPASESMQPDITSSVQRLRFAPGGGTQSATVRNDGGKTLVISGVSSLRSSFSTTLAPVSLESGESANFQISYNGSPSQGSDVILIHSNDPDEADLPIQVYGNTPSADPGEPAADFTLPVLKRNPATGAIFYDSFTLSQQQGKVVWFQVYGSW